MLICLMNYDYNNFFERFCDFSFHVNNHTLYICRSNSHCSRYATVIKTWMRNVADMVHLSNQSTLHNLDNFFLDNMRDKNWYKA